MGLVTVVILNDTAQGVVVTLIAEAAESSRVFASAAVPVVTVKVDILHPAVVDCPDTVGVVTEKPPGAAHVVSPTNGEVSQKSTMIAWMLGLPVEIVLNATAYVVFVALSVALLILILRLVTWLTANAVCLSAGSNDTPPTATAAAMYKPRTKR